MARNESLELWGIIRRELLAGELITRGISVVFVRISSRHSVYGLGKLIKFHRAPIVAGVSRDMRSVSMNTRCIRMVYKQASDDDWMKFGNLYISPLLYPAYIVLGAGM